MTFSRLGIVGRQTEEYQISQSPIEQNDQTDFVLLVNSALMANHSKEWELLKKHLDSIIEIITKQPLLSSHLGLLKVLVGKVSDHLAEEKLTIICQLAAYLSSQPLNHRFGSDFRWETDLLLSMQWLQIGIRFANRTGNKNKLEELYVKADHLFSRFIILEIIEDDKLIGVIRAVGPQIWLNRWRGGQKSWIM